MRDQHHGFARVGEPPQGKHEPLLKAGIEAARGFVEEADSRLGNQFSGNTDALALAARKILYPLEAVFAQLHQIKRLIGALADLGGAGVGGQAQPTDVGEGAVDRQGAMDGVILRHVTD